MFSTKKENTHNEEKKPQASFTVQPGSGLFNVTIKFQEDREDEAAENIQFTTKKADHFTHSYENYLKNSSLKGGCVDVQPINGIYQKNLIKSLFKSSVVNDLVQQLKFLDSHEQKKFAKVFVLDVKDSKGKYDLLKDIEKAEKEVEQFFEGKEPK